MGDLQLNGIVLRNWAKFENAHVQFPEYGLVVVSGINTASGGKLMSVGSGKTAFGEAIGRALFGIQTRFVHMKDASRDQKGDTYVRIAATYRGKPLIVETGYKCKELSPSGEALRFTYDGQIIERGKIQQTRDELNALLEMTAPLAAWTVFVDGQHMNFQALEQSDAVNLVMTALKQPPWSQYHEKVRKSLRDCERAVAVEQAKVANAQETVRLAQDSVYSATQAVEQASRTFAIAVNNQKTQQALKLQSILAHQESVTKAEVRQREIAKEMKSLEESQAARHHQLEIALNASRDKTQAMAKKRKQFIEVREAATSAHALAEQRYKTLADMPSTCPTCGKPMDKCADPSELQSAKETLQTAQMQLEKCKTSYRQFETDLAALTEAERSVSRELAEHGTAAAVAKLNEEHRHLATTIRDSTDAIHRLQMEIERLAQGVSDEAVKRAQAVLEERQRAQQEAETRLTTSAREVVEAKQALDVVAYWCAAFSPVGIPNMVLEESIAPLNHEARRIASVMTGGTLNIRFSTKRTLVGGEARPKLNVVVENALGSADARLSSKGEGGLTNFILAETLGAVGRVSHRIGFRFYDEIVPHQDAVVCQSLYSYLRDIAQEQRILIFIVDHNPSVNNYADYFLQVEKTGSNDACASTVRWL